ncbi:MAG: L-aspartate aminotransferase [Acidobacteria bacterium RIFCSPLOWO2_02_FULL_61_28]|nr:MAG: L-aspartate aminotransferase [Acidobacteria bacterium RIFCSPLOWO2_02_FULL_61_28]
MSNVQLNSRTGAIALSDRVGRISVSSTLAVMMEAEKLRAEGADIVDFGAGEPDFPTPDNVKEAAIRAIRDNFSKYTAAGGTSEVRAAIAYRHATDFGTSYAPAEVIATAGGKQAIFNLISCLINPGDDVLLPVPFWVTFRDVINYAGGRAILVETREEENFDLTAEMVKEALTPRTRLVIVNSPSNPSGAVIPAPELERILEVTANHGALLLTDECYCHFLYEDKPFSVAALPGAKEHVAVVGSLSKTYAMTGWRLGYALAPAPVVSAMVKLQSHSTSNPSSIAQKAAVEGLTGPQDSVQVMLKEYHRRRDFVIERLHGIPGVTCTVPRGAFYAYPNVAAFLHSGDHPGAKSGGTASPNEMAKKLLREAGVAVVPGEAFGTEHHFRISYATSMENLAEGLRRIKRFFSEQTH